MATDEEAEVSWLTDERGARLMVGVETDRIKLAAVVPADVPRSQVRRTVRKCSRELEHFVEVAAGEADRRSGDEGN